MTRGYLISDGFRDRIESTIERVHGTPYGGLSDTRVPRVDSPQQPAGGDTIRVKIHQNFPTLEHTPLAVGQGIALPMNRNTQTRLVPSVEPEKLSGPRTSHTVAAEADLTSFAASGAPEFYIEFNDADITSNARCGVIKSVSDEPEESYWDCVVQVRGLVRCRVLLLQDGQSVIPPPPYPQNETLQPFWRRYLMAATYGYSSLLGIGARFRLNGTNTYPTVAEAVVNLG